MQKEYNLHLRNSEIEIQLGLNLCSFIIKVIRCSQQLAMQLVNNTHIQHCGSTMKTSRVALEARTALQVRCVTGLGSDRTRLAHLSGKGNVSFQDCLGFTLLGNIYFPML